MLVSEKKMGLEAPQVLGLNPRGDQLPIDVMGTQGL